MKEEQSTLHFDESQRQRQSYKCPHLISNAQNNSHGGKNYQKKKKKKNAHIIWNLSLIRGDLHKTTSERNDKYAFIQDRMCEIIAEFNFLVYDELARIPQRTNTMRAQITDSRPVIATCGCRYIYVCFGVSAMQGMWLTFDLCRGRHQRQRGKTKDKTNKRKRDEKNYSFFFRILITVWKHEIQGTRRFFATSTRSTECNLQRNRF